MSNKHQPLTQADVDQLSLPADIMRALGRLQESGCAPERIRVLDVDRGRGAFVLALLQRGYDAYGLEVDEKTLAQGKTLFEASGFSWEQRLCHTASEPWPFVSEIFDVVFSNQVLEHVRDLAWVAMEIARVTVPDGIGIHLFPAKWQVKEPHVFVPFVHWFPKQPLRRYWLHLHHHRLPHWVGHDNLALAEKIAAFYDYLDQKTYYRSNRAIARAFRVAGLRVRFDDRLLFSTSGRSSSRRRNLKHWWRFFSQWHARTFSSVRLITRKGSVTSLY